MITEARPAESIPDADDVDHIVCDCDEDLALCGFRLPSDAPWIEEGETINCVDCLLLAMVPCARCGA